MSSEEPNKMAHYGLWGAQALMAFLFFMGGANKVISSPEALLEMGMTFAGRLSPMTVKVIGGLEALGAVGLILPSALRIQPILTPIAAACLVLTMVVAAAEHGMNGEFASIGVNVVLGTICLAIAVGRLKVAPIE